MSSLDELRKAKTNALDELCKKRDEINKQLRDLAKPLFLESSKAVFEKHPELKSFSWTQYTPHFNDGDECTFRTNTEDPRIQFGDEDKREDFYPTDHVYVGTGVFENKWGRNTEITKKVPREVTPEYTAKKEAYEAVRNLLDSFKEDEYKLMFGDHAIIVVNPTSIDVDEYDHD